jgi:hypothetical protein
MQHSPGHHIQSRHSQVRRLDVAVQLAGDSPPLPYIYTRDQRRHHHSAATIESSIPCLGNQSNMVLAIISNQGTVKCGVQMAPYHEWETALLWPIIPLGENRDEMRRCHLAATT